MSKPQLRAEGIICNSDISRVLVQCDQEESFYRFPGGSVEFGETAGEAIKRELIEEYDLTVRIGGLALVNENIIGYDGEPRHDCTLLHWCGLSDESDVADSISHKEHKGTIKLIWKTVDELKERPLYPEGILKMLQDKRNKEIQQHLIVREKYED